MKKTKGLTKPAASAINAVLIVLLFFVFYFLRQEGIITNYWDGVLIVVGINIILAVSLNIPTGYLGQLPLGHSGFMAVGAYVTGIFLKGTSVSKALSSGDTGRVILYVVPAILLSALIAGFIGLIIGIPALRLKGDYLAIITLGFGEIIRVVLTNIDDVLGFKFTYGSAGLKRIPKFTSFPLIFIMIVISCYLIHVMMKSRHGRNILSIRENEIAAESVGINTTRYKTVAFVFSAMLAGVAGSLYAGYLGSLYPSTFGFMKSIEILVFVVLGGMGSMLGSILSAATLTILQELLREVASYRMLLYSAMLILMMLFRPKGLLGSYDFSMRRILNKILFKKNLQPAAAEAKDEEVLK